MFWREFYLFMNKYYTNYTYYDKMNDKINAERGMEEKMDNNDMYQSGQPAGTEPENSQVVNNNNTGNDYNGNTYTGNNNGNYQQYPYNNYNYNGNYQAPYQQNSPLDLEEPMKMSEWLISLLITLIPCVGLIMIFVWAFGSTEKKSKSNFFKAYLVFGVIRIAIFLIYVFFYAAYGISNGLYK